MKNVYTLNNIPSNYPVSTIKILDSFITPRSSLVSLPSKVLSCSYTLISFAMNICITHLVHIIFISLRLMQENGVYNVFNLIRNCPNICQSDFTILHSYQQYIEKLFPSEQFIGIQWYLVHLTMLCNHHLCLLPNLFITPK